VTAGFAALLNATTPLWAAVIAAAWLGQRIAGRQVVGLLVALAGVVVLVWGRIDLHPGGGGWAIVAGLAAPVSYGIAPNFTRRFLTRTPPLAQATGSQIGATAWLLPLAVSAWPATLPPASAWLAVAVMGVASTGVAYVLYFRLIANVGAVRASAVTFLIPVFAVAWGYALLGETVTVNMVVGGAIVLMGTALTLGLGARPGHGARPAAPGGARSDP
jgi:drug/metabolite transporter (DMT)-like permease